MQELIKKLNRRYTMSMFVTNAMMYDTMNDERKGAADLIESQAAEIEKYKTLCDLLSTAIAGGCDFFHCSRLTICASMSFPFDGFKPVNGRHFFPFEKQGRNPALARR